MSQKHQGHYWKESLDLAYSFKITRIYWQIRENSFCSGQMNLCCKKCNSCSEKQLSWMTKVDKALGLFRPIGRKTNYTALASNWATLTSSMDNTLYCKNYIILYYIYYINYTAPASNWATLTSSTDNTLYSRHRPRSVVFFFLAISLCCFQFLIFIWHKDFMLV